MNAAKIEIAERCLKAAYEKTMAFPEILRTLIEAGFEGYSVDYRRNTTIYFMADDSHVELENIAVEEKVAPRFDQAGIIAQIKWAQSNAADYFYSAFCKNVKAFGCAGYIVSFSGKRVLYYGRTAETHVEHFPA